MGATGERSDIAVRLGDRGSVLVLRFVPRKPPMDAYRLQLAAFDSRVAGAATLNPWRGVGRGARLVPSKDYGALDTCRFPI